MQTFLPYPDFAESARVLDRKRLGKQRAEAIQVLRGLHIPTYGWRHHPAVKMWRGYEHALITYGLVVSREWRDRGYADTTHVEFERHAHDGLTYTQEALADLGMLPAWLGDPDFHRAHQSSLVRKDPEWYRRFFPDVPDDLPYIWPPPLDQSDADDPPSPAAPKRRSATSRSS